MFSCVPATEARIEDMSCQESNSRLRRIVQRLGGGHLTIPSSGTSPEQPLQGKGIHDPLHGWQTWSESNSLHKGEPLNAGRICIRICAVLKTPPEPSCIYVQPCMNEWYSRRLRCATEGCSTVCIPSCMYVQRYMDQQYSSRLPCVTAVVVLSLSHIIYSETKIHQAFRLRLLIQTNISYV